jgi:hypothetical protein
MVSLFTWCVVPVAQRPGPQACHGLHLRLQRLLRSDTDDAFLGCPRHSSAISIAASRGEVKQFVVTNTRHKQENIVNKFICMPSRLLVALVATRRTEKQDTGHFCGCGCNNCVYSTRVASVG